MNDYISRQAVLEILSSRNAAWDGYNKVMDMPAADVRGNVRGEWISNGVEAFGVVEYWVCNQCYDQSKYRTNFCPSCGADMRGNNDETD